MRLILFFISLFCLQFPKAQTKTFDLKWENVKLVSESGTVYQAPLFQNQYCDASNLPSAPIFKAVWLDDGLFSAQITISELETEVLNPADLGDLNVSLLPNSLESTVEKKKARNDRYVHFSFNPIFFKDEKPVRVKKITISSNLDSPSQLNIDLPKSIVSSGSTQTIFSLSSSVLGSGSWYKFYVEEEGIYRIDKSFLASLGMDIDNINPKNLKIYGNQGGMLPLKNENTLAIDPKEYSIKVIGEEDGRFDTQDYILFYAPGPNNWNEESQTFRNSYTDKAFYYITTSANSGKRVAEASQPSGAATKIYDSYDARLYHEQDNYNLANMGRRWFGERFDVETTQILPFEFENRIAEQPVRITAKVAAVSSVPTSLDIDANGQKAITFNLPALPSNINTIFATQDFANPLGGSLTQGAKFADVLVSGNTLTIQLSYNNFGNPSAQSFLDYIEVKAKCLLQGIGRSFPFEIDEITSSLGIAQFSLSNASAINQVWNVTSPFEVRSFSNSENRGLFSFKDQMGSKAKYWVLEGTSFAVPKIEAGNTLVSNQDIKGSIFQKNGSFRDLDYLIICPQQLFPQAKRLADLHESKRGLRTAVITLENIYTEFNCSNSDIAAIRNFIRYVYLNGSDTENTLKFVCLFGDASYDYKNRIPNNTNLVPVFHAYESFNVTSAIMSDDFYAMMDENEGTLLTGDLMDVAVGRIVADNATQASDMVAKIESYFSEEAQGKWRNRFVLVSDDVDQDWEGIIQGSLDNLGDELYKNKPFINVTKIHSDAYKQQATAGGNRYPAVNEAIRNSLDVGAIMLDYFGHGSELGLASERIFEQSDALELSNGIFYPLFVTVTCEFTRFDNPRVTTAGELTYWNKTGGALSLISTTRQIFVGTGINFNNQLSSHLFSYGSDEYPAIGEALRRTKVSIGGNTQKRVIFLVGDPSIPLPIAKPRISLTHINDKPLTQPTDTLKALSRIKMKGAILGQSDNLISDFDGEVAITLFDKNINRQTLANDNTRDINGQLIQMDFETLGATIFSGKASVKGGVFEFEFVVPRDISIAIDKGRVSFYATKNGSNDDRTGYNDTFLVGGINENAEEDITGPEILLYLNDETFVSGGITNESPILIAILSDENGINTVGGIGHDIIAILDGDEENPIILNEYYEADLDDFTKGRLTFPFKDLEAGLHTLTLRAWDVYNNSSIMEIQFLVLDEGQLVLERVLNYPNPFTSYTEFWFQHNKPFEPLEVLVQVFTVSGKLIWSAQQNVVTEGFLSRDIIWDGKDDFGDRVGKGVYVYKLTVRSTLTNKKAEKYEKLVVL